MGQEGDGSQKGLDKFMAQPQASPCCMPCGEGSLLPPTPGFWPGVGGICPGVGVLAALTLFLALQPAPLLLHYSIKDKRR